MDVCTQVAHLDRCREEQGKHWSAPAEQGASCNHTQTLQWRQQRILKRRKVPLLRLLRLTKPWHSLVLTATPPTKQRPQTNNKGTRPKYQTGRFLHFLVSLAVAL
jgi:hypothetical protein